MAAPTLLTYGPANVDETLTLAMTNMIPGIKDNVFNDNTALGWFYSTGKERKRGGASLSHGVRYQKSTSGGSYSRYQEMNVTPQDNMTRDQWAWKQKYWSVSIDGFTERVSAKGDWAIEDALPKALSVLERNGRLAVISFHSLEDRIVKKSFINFQNLKLGKIIWETKTIPNTNLFSYTNPNFPFINHHWLSENIFYLHHWEHETANRYL